MINNSNDLIKEWYKFSMMDWDTANYIYNMQPKPLEIICYHCQQSAEKMLKGFLVSNAIEPPRTHDLHQLRNECVKINVDFEDLYDICAFLTQYGIQPRYPNEINVSEIDAEKALQSVKTIIDFFENHSIEVKAKKSE